MSKREMAAWYLAICTAAAETPVGDGEGDLESWEAFFLEWPRLLFVEAGRPGGFPWNHETD